MESKVSNADVPRKQNWISIAIRLVIGMLVGTAITSIPWLVSKLNHESLWPINFLMLPGTVVALAAGGGNVHTYSFFVLIAGNVIAYALITYWFLSARIRNHL